MASSCGPFHDEALRRQRVVDKKREALRRMAERKEVEERMLLEKARQDEEERQNRHNQKLKELQKHLSDVQDDGRSTRKSGIPAEIFKQIKKKEKILRNSNLVQGHPNTLWGAR